IRPVVRSGERCELARWSYLINDAVIAPGVEVVIYRHSVQIAISGKRQPRTRSDSAGKTESVQDNVLIGGSDLEDAPSVVTTIGIYGCAKQVPLGILHQPRKHRVPAPGAGNTEGVDRLVGPRRCQLVHDAFVRVALSCSIKVSVAPLHGQREWTVAICTGATKRMQQLELASGTHLEDRACLVRSRSGCRSVEISTAPILGSDGNL